MRRFAVGALVALAAVGLVVGGSLFASRLLTQTPLTERCVATAGSYTAELGFEQAENAALISALAVRRELPARAVTIALATAYQESGIRNLEYGDRDSLGLFQQRPSMGWGTAEQIMDPYYSTTTFYRHLIKVIGYERLPIAEAAQRVQRSAYGDAYAQHEPNARALASSFTGNSPAAFSCTLITPPARGSASAVRADLERAFGIADTGGERALRVRPERRAVGWAVAHWAVANAKRLGIASVTYAGYRWAAEASTDGWQLDDTAARNVAVITPASGA